MLARLRYAAIHSAARAAIRLTQPLTGIQPISVHTDEDVFIVGFPKSGHTWCQYLLAGLLCGIDPAQCPDSLVQDIVPEVGRRDGYKRYTRPVFFKSHELPQKDYRRVVYLLRDGRDAMVSYFHYCNARVQKIDFPTLVREAPGLDARWHQHVEAWLANPHKAELLVVKYEDLRREPFVEFRKIAAFAGLSPDETILAKAVEGAAFDRQQQRETKLGWDDAAWPKDKRFVRRGKVGSFRDEMPPEALALFEAEAGPTLRRLGYSLD